MGGKILVVDDEPMVRETVGRLLVDEGYRVEFAEDGADAIAKVAADRPDVILLDLMMPGMNGRQFLTALRQGLGQTDLPVVVMTAVHGLGLTATSLGATDVVEKPFNVDALLNKIALALFRAREYDHPPVPPALAGPAIGAGAAAERGVVLVIDHDRDALRRLDTLLSARGYTVVSMSRVTPQLPRLARVLEPRAILVDVDVQGEGEGVEVLRALRAEPALDDVPILAFSRADGAVDSAGDGVKFEIAELANTVTRTGDDDLLRFVDRPWADAGPATPRPPPS